MEHFASYKAGIFSRETRKRKLSEMKEVLTRMAGELDFYALVCTGQSGLFAAMLANEMDLDLIAVRKNGEPTPHCNLACSGVLHDGGYVFVDDLIDSGDSLVRCIKAINKTCADLGVARQPKFVGALLYNSTWQHNYKVKDYVCNQEARELIPPEPRIWTSELLRIRT